MLVCSCWMPTATHGKGREHHEQRILLTSIVSLYFDSLEIYIYFDQPTYYPMESSFATLLRERVCSHTPPSGSDRALVIDYLEDLNPVDFFFNYLVPNTPLLLGSNAISQWPASSEWVTMTQSTPPEPPKTDLHHAPPTQPRAHPDPGPGPAAARAPAANIAALLERFGEDALVCMTCWLAPTYLLLHPNHRPCAFNHDSTLCTSAAVV